MYHYIPLLTKKERFCCKDNNLKKIFDGIIKFLHSFVTDQESKNSIGG